MVLTRLSRDSDAVLMDLRGFKPENQGCVFEINELLNVGAARVGATTDLAFLRETFATGWATLAANWPNRASTEPRVFLFEFASEGSVPGLMRVASEAARRDTPDLTPPGHSASDPLPATAAPPRVGCSKSVL